MMLLVSEQQTEQNEESGVERRRGLRIEQQRPIKLLEPSLGKYYGGQTKDVSSTGLRLDLPVSAAVRPGKLVNIHVGVGASGGVLANRRQMIPARVVWIDRSQPGKLSAGIEFLASISARLDAA
ncbi:MAG TPA: PilZ domain-containing protein [Tepidisphaeraceae bacterium]|jgi:hypothetical protein|nr:PilZ domain-containing protein [Tepidisphaeraceae bacterium]